MGNFNNQRNDKRHGGDNRSFEKPQMNPAVCSKCGKTCLVPFKPTGNRPIFCNDCFKTEGNSSLHKNQTSSRFSSDRNMFDAICDKCGNRCQIPFQPRPGRQVFCSHCFERNESQSKNLTDRPQNFDQLTALNIKLDKILQLLTTQKEIAHSTEVIDQNDKKTVKDTSTKKMIKTDKKVTPKKKVVSKKSVKV